MKLVSICAVSLAVVGLTFAACDNKKKTEPAPAQVHPAMKAPAKAEPIAKVEPAAKPAPVAKPAPAVAKTTLAVGSAAPDFTLSDADGNEVVLSKLQGKIVVLEWFNPDCPFVKYAYKDGPLREQAKKTVGDDIVWLQVNSGAAGKQGHGVERNKKAREDWALPSAVLIDEDGSVGRLYEAKTTPHLFIVDKAGKLAYRGGIDNAPLGNAPEGEASINYVSSAIADIAAGKPVSVPETKAYGCSVKYVN
ncbi:MAG: peroxiredoxin [Myxococcota bacterium]|jgi:peroxiredoxin